jgi:hypothetical protein
VTRYPGIIGEVDTLAEVCAGRSIARYGDGEFALCRLGVRIKCERGSPELSARLRGILHNSGECLVGIPNLRAAGPKQQHWSGYSWASTLLADRVYHSAFISRADSAPWINTPEYWAALESLWIGQDVTLVRGESQRALQVSDLIGARSVREVIGPSADAYASYHDLLEQVGTPDRALLCLGPTATVMAVDLCAKGGHAIDLGHVAWFLRKARRGEPMQLTHDEKYGDNTDPRRVAYA